MTQQQLEDHFKAVKAAYHAQFEIVRTPLGYQARHKETHEGYHAHSVSVAPGWKVL